METIQQLNSDSTDNITESQQHEEPPKGFRSLPRELRDKIYKLTLLPELEYKKHCSRTHLNGGHLASTCQSAESKLLGMDLNHISCKREIREDGASAQSKNTSILLVCRQIFKEASQVLYENTKIRLVPDLPSISHWAKWVPDCISRLCPPYALQHIRSLSLSFYQFFGQMSPHLLTGILALPSLRHVELHIDLLHRGQIHAADFAFLSAFTDHVEFAIDVHILSTFHDDGTGWAPEVVDDESCLVHNQEFYAEAWIMATERAFKLRKGFVEDLGAIFQQHGKELKIKDY